MEPHDREVAALFALLRTRRRGVSWWTVASDVELTGSALALLEGPEDGALLPPVAIDAELDAAAGELRLWRDCGYRFITVLDDDYPSRLRDIREVPPFLFYDGELRSNDPGMSVVGSRAASPWGLDFAARVARFLVSEGLAVIGGLAVGIDTAAHRAALASGGRTVAFIGAGISRAYPKENAGLQREIAGHGVVFSQFYPDAPPTKKTFPMRNASMSGYGLATIVIDAGEHSGSRIQARLAGEHGRPVILTDRVAGSTTWGAALAGSPNVHVVSDLSDLKRAVDEVREGPDRLQEALATLQTS